MGKWYFHSSKSCRRLLCGVLLCLLSLPCAGQEALDLMLQRGYVAHWLVCGPFDADVAGGIGAALARGEAPLGDTDFMQPVGGIARLRPEHLLLVRPGEDGAVWQFAGTTGETLDLEPFFPEAKEGVAYAAFYAESDRRQAVYLDVQTPLGARLWLNGFPVREATARPLAKMGVDRFVAPFRPGSNLVVLEVPGAAYERMAEAMGISMRDLNVHGFENRPLLRGTSGFEIAVRLKPAYPLGDLFYVPRLEPAYAFSGTKFDVRQDMLLTLFNPAPEASVSVDVMLSTADSSDPMLRRVESIPAESEHQVRLPISTGNRMAGQQVGVTVRMVAGDPVLGEANAAFKTNVTVVSHAEGGRVYVVTGQRFLVESAESEGSSMGRYLQSAFHQILLSEQEPEYGFDMGTASQWQGLLTAYPELRDRLLTAVGSNRCAVEGVYAHPDERVVGGEVLARNLLYGLLSSRELLGGAPPAYFAWDNPGMAAQTPQLAARAGLAGVVSNVEVAGLPSLFQQEALDGSVVLHRRKKPSPGPVSVEALRGMAELQRRELLEQGITSDVLVSESLVPQPEPFYAGAGNELHVAYPSIRLAGNGGAAFFSELDKLGYKRKGALPRRGTAMTLMQPGSVAALPALKSAHATVENRLLTAETFSTFASLLGARYPDAALDAAWRQVLYWSDARHLGRVEKAENHVDALAAYRSAAEKVDDVLRGALGYIAARVDTASTAPSQRDKVSSLVVFNPTARTRTDVCDTVIQLDETPGFSLRDAYGNEVPFEAMEARRVNGRFLAELRIRFIARNVPAMGYRCYYLIPSGALPEASPRADAQIENDALLLIVDPVTGAIQSLVDKATGTDYAAGLLNHFVLLDEDSAKNEAGGEIWTSGTWQEPDSPATAVEGDVRAWMQRLLIRSSFGSGELVRTLTLYAGIPRVDCEMRLEGVPLAGRMLVASFEPPTEGRTPVYGERFGALAGRQSRSVFDFRTKGMDNLSGAGLQPALRWAALSPSEHIQIGPEGAVPIGPATVVAGEDEDLQRSARAIQSALIQRGIPSIICPDTPDKPDFLWSDATEFPSPESSLDYTGLHIVIGGPEENSYAGRILEKQSKLVVDLFNARLSEGVAMVVLHEDVPTDFPPVPVLLFAGRIPAQSAELARLFATSMAARGVYTLPPSSFQAGEPPRTADHGLSLLFPGAQLCSYERDGALTVLFGHGLEREDSTGLWPAEDRLARRYALYPFEGDWRQARIPAAAQAFEQSFLSLQTDLHYGEAAQAESFLALDGEAVLVASVRPAGDPTVRLSAGEAQPREGVVLRLWESLGQTQSTALSGFTPIRQAKEVDFLGALGAPLTVDQGVASVLDVAPFETRSLWFLPGTPENLGPRATIARDADAEATHYTQYWKHNAGPASLGFAPASILLRGDLSGGSGKIQVLAGNHLSDERVTGKVQLLAPDGWSLGPDNFEVSLDPGEFEEKTISILRTRQAIAGPGSGGLVATATIGGKVYRDTLEENPAPLEMDVKRVGGQVQVQVRNASGIPAKGTAELVTLPHLWPELGRRPVVTAMPLRNWVSVPAFGKQNLLFQFSDPEIDAWAVVKVAANGHVLYTPVPAPTEL
jgi:alpha-mannosidase